ncbi:MAG: hypothetical protein HOV81_03030 [Kofleriaceae bacterium]|nr:hypothetical protein [Kofleriaceae bacterium]
MKHVPVADPVEAIDEPARLAPEVACISPVRLGQRSRARELLVGAQAELVSLVPRTGVTFALALLFAVFMAAPRTMRVFVESKADIARATVKKYAFEAYPRWRAWHPNAACPERLDELNEYMNNEHTHDPWGGVYEMSCNELGILVWTVAEDGRPGTADDIRSDR